jgi:hypothetical protein
MTMTPNDTYQSAAEARDAAITFQHWENDQDFSYGELYSWQCHWETVLLQFPELADEFRENGII